MHKKSILLVIAGGIAAYKSLLLIRELSKRGIACQTILTKGGAEFITPLTVSGLTGKKCYTELFDVTDEMQMGHIALSRMADLLVVAPATADLMAKAANGIADDLAATVLLATDTPVLFAPAMNVRMWQHPATQRNVRRLREDGAQIITPEMGEMACGEVGPGRMAEPTAIADAVEAHYIAQAHSALTGKHVLVTAGPTHEPLDPVRYVANRSSGKQGYAIAQALAHEGARVTLISGPVSLSAPVGVQTVHVATAREMLAACEAALPADIAICCAAVADYRPEIETEHKIKKERGGLSAISLTENPDILKTICTLDAGRPKLVIGFAAETEDMVGHAEAKRQRKGCDWIIANNVAPGTGTMGGDHNTVVLLTDKDDESWENMPKIAVAQRLTARITAEIAHWS